MGTGEPGAPTKAAKTLPTQDQRTAPTSYPEWAAAFQAYYNSGGQPPPGYFPPSVVSGPQPNPYLWGGQPMMPPYGTPPAYAAVYSHGGMYAHPPIPPGAHHYSQYGMPSSGGASDASMITPAGGEMDANRGTDPVQVGSPLKPSKGSLGMLTGKGGYCGKGNCESANGVCSQSSGESASDGSSEGSEENNSQHMPRKRNFDQISLDGAGMAGGNGMPLFNSQAGDAYATPSSGVSVGQPLAGAPLNMSRKVSSGGIPTANLGIGMQDYWSGSNPGPGPSGRAVKRISACTSSGMVTSTPSTPSPGVGGRDVVPPELWLQDEREVKRQRRKQSNRESARRSRLRKQAECEELGSRVDSLTMENMALRTEVARLSEECKKLTSDHSSLLGQLRKYRLGDTIGPNEGGDCKHEEVIMQSDNSGKIEEECNISSPRKQIERQEEDSSCGTERPCALDDEVDLETIGAG